MIKLFNASYRSVLDAGELADNALDLLELDAETANLDLAVTASHKLDVARRQVTDDVARAINAVVFFLTGERVGNKDFGSLLGAVQVTAAHLGACYPQFAGRTHGQAVSLRIDDIQAYVLRRFADGNLLHFLVHQIIGDEYR